MANTKLSPQQQAKLKKVMAIPTRNIAPAPQTAYQAPTLNVPTSPSPIKVNVDVLSKKATTFAPTVTTVVGSAKASVVKKSNPILPLLFLIIGIILLGAYAFFWLKFFNIHLFGL
ncbi:MAG TPA: hypothetical protein VMR41_04250 [Patescibacteria group bacterium]|nr:hypothetical protein [Patescibacteria group bacterium]